MDKNEVFLILFWLSLEATATVAYNCEGRYIDNHCINVRLDGKDWERSEEACSYYSIPDFSDAHLAAITSAGRHRRMVEFMKEMGIRISWLGGRRNNILWKWLEDNTDLSSQGCYSNLITTHNFHIPQSDTLLDTTAKCVEKCYDWQKGFAATLDKECYCGDRIERDANAVTCGGSDFTVFRVGGLPGKWGNGEPRNVPDKLCVSLKQGFGLKSNNCSLRLRFICKLKTTQNSPPTSYMTCQQPYTRILNACYWLSDILYTWQTAKQACSNQLGDLLSITSTFIQDPLENWLAGLSITEDVWVGGYKGGWFWLAANTFSFTNWAPGEPKPSSPSSPNDCIMINPKTSYQWSAIGCPSSPIYFLCQVGYDYSSRPNGEAIIINVLLPSNITPPTQSPLITLPQITFGTEDVRLQNIEVLDHVDKNNVKIVTWVFIGVAIFLVFLILFCCLIFLFVKKRRKIDVVVDARPVAHLPESSTEKLRDNDQLATVA